MDKIFQMMTLATLRMYGVRDEERGQGTLEYVGMIIVAALLVVAVLTAAGTVDLGGVFTKAVNSVTGGGS